MTSSQHPSYAALPRTSGVDHPATAALHRLRGPAALLLRRRYDLHLHHDERVPLHGPVILAANHTGWFDGPLMTVLSPRAAHVLTKEEMFEGRGRRFFEWAGQIELDRRHPDPAAVKTALRVLRSGHVVGIFPEGARGNGEYDRIRGGAAYLALVTGAPVVPVTLFGTRQPGEDSHAKPARGARIDLVYGEPWRVDPKPWPRRRADVAAATAKLHKYLRSCVAEAKQITGRTLPGQLPAGDDELVGDRDERGTSERPSPPDSAAEPVGDRDERGTSERPSPPDSAAEPVGDRDERGTSERPSPPDSAAEAARQDAQP